jgi:hypothetical protein
MVRGSGWRTLGAQQRVIRFDLTELCDDCAIRWLIHLGQQRARAWRN